MTIGVLSLSAVIIANRQQSAEALQARLTRLFPEAVLFSEKTGNPPHYKVFNRASRSGDDLILSGFAFHTTDVEPLERAYDGPIQILVGMNLVGTLTGIIVVDHNEPYGYFSVDQPEFAAQFIRKSIRDRFKVGDDVDAISQATISVRSAARGIRNSARRIARRFLNPENVK